MINNSYAGEESESADNIELKDIVNHVIDGDTLDIDDIRVRLSLIDTSEKWQDDYKESKNLSRKY